MTPLELWAAKKIGTDGEGLTRQQVGRYQIQKLRETIRQAYANSPFYRRRLQGFAETELACLNDFRRFPFTTADDIRRDGLQFLCVSQGDISRVVTLDSSGTTGPAKRLYFTPADQELTIDFFRFGMAALAEAGDRVLILLPGERTGSVGDLLGIALNRLGARPIPYGIVRSIPATLEVMAREAVDCIVGIPSQVLALARYANTVAKQPLRLKSVLLSTDHVPRSIIAELKKLWGCDVFEHYGMTEMGLGGGTDCAAHAGYHLHEADFYFEIVDPLTGEAMPDGQVGEVVVTTLTRRGMPLIRYRTGDISRFLPEPCGCGAILRRLDRITTRKGRQIMLSGLRHFTIADLDEAVFTVDGVIDFTASVDNARAATELTISALMVDQPEESNERALHAALDTVTAIRMARQAGELTVVVRAVGCGGIIAQGPVKRAIADLGEADGKQDSIFDSAWKNPT